MAETPKSPAKKAPVKKALAAVKTKFDIFCGEDKCRFLPVAAPGAQPSSPGPGDRSPGPADGDHGSAPDTYEALGSDKVARNLGQIATMGVGGALRRPVKSFQILGVDQSTLAALSSAVGHTGSTYPEIMAFLRNRHYEEWMTEEDRRLGWTRVTVIMKRVQDPNSAREEEEEDGGLGKSEAFIRRHKPLPLREVATEPAQSSAFPNPMGTRTNTL
ncbi:unnamed protein product [Ostreobium quekettii]|uniref:Uncharacterized protein n=1 Tax=Ostreobium quekettii TaxID=121088 RepID=A0A8S1ISD2_9CHLO|nr:unnamed protein product [Ostreobium quekettii]|eukprot:evm.model.scf_9.19 EVM.evm.TU.scf_9.19   scf_9:255097-255744(-)